MIGTPLTLQADFPRNRRHPREWRLLALEPRQASIKIALPPTPGRWLRHARQLDDLIGAHVISCGQHAPGPPRELEWFVAVAA